MPPAVPAVNKINVVPGADPNTGGQPFTAAGQDQGLATSQGMQNSGENVKPEMLTGEKSLKGLYNLNKKERKFGK
jgi:hypothetical protein